MALTRRQVTKEGREEEDLLSSPKRIDPNESAVDSILNQDPGGAGPSQAQDAIDFLRDQQRRADPEGAFLDEVPEGADPKLVRSAQEGLRADLDRIDQRFNPPAQEAAPTEQQGTPTKGFAAGLLEKARSDWTKLDAKRDEIVTAAKRLGITDFADIKKKLEEQGVAGLSEEFKPDKDLLIAANKEKLESEETTQADKSKALLRGLPEDLRDADLADRVFNQLDQEGALPAHDPKERRLMANEFNGRKVVQDQVLIQGQADRVEAALVEGATSESLIGVDQSLITIFNKMLDPTSVVRESEYARTGEDQALMNRWRGKKDRLTSGGAGLTTEDRLAIARLAIEFSRLHNERYQDAASQQRRLAIRQGINPIDIIPPEAKRSRAEIPTEPGAEAVAAPDAREKIKSRRAAIARERAEIEARR